jgi:hypothetical protein
MFALHGCAIGRCDTWEVDSSYAGSSIHGMVVCKDLIRGYDKNKDKLVYNEVARILRESGGKYSHCSVVDNSLIISTRNNQIFLKIDCLRKESK